MNNTTRLAGIVLCGGQSSRMGRPKCDLPFGNETMLGRVVRLVGQVAEHVIVVAATGQKLAVPADVRLVRDRQPDLGPVEGIAVGLAAAAETADAAFVTGCDVPLLVPDVVRLLADHLGRHDLVAIDDGNYQHPLCAVYRCSLFAAARQLIQDGSNTSARTLLHRANAKFLTPADLAAVDPQLRSLRNVNSPAAYVAAAETAGVSYRL